MKAKRLLILVTPAALLVVGFLAYWKLPQHYPAPVSTDSVMESKVAGTNDENEPPPTPIQKGESSEPRVPPGLDPKGWKELVKMQSFFAKQNGPVAFYGVVVDQQRIHVSGVAVKLKLGGYNERALWQKSIFKLTDNDFTRNEEVTLVSDAQGRFALTGKTGSWMSVALVEKEGYLWSFTSGMEPISLDYNPTRVKTLPSYADPTKGVTFHVWKQGVTEPWTSVQKRIRVQEQDSDYGINLLSDSNDGQPAPKPDLIVRLRFISKDTPGHQYDQQMVLETPSGGLLETQDPYLYQASDQGYQQRYDYVITPADLKSSGWKRKYYVKSRSGRIVAGLNVTFTLFPYAFQIDGTLNPHGSRNLEPDPAKQITDEAEIRRLDVETSK